MCEITPREAIRITIKDKLKVLQKREPVLAELFQALLDLDEEQQKPPIYHITNPAPKPPFHVGDWPGYWWNGTMPHGNYTITLTNNASTGHYALEADTST